MLRQETAPATETVAVGGERYKISISWWSSGKTHSHHASVIGWSPSISAIRHSHSKQIPSARNPETVQRV